MNRKGFVFSIATLAFLILTSAGCGSSNRQLQAITVTPSSANPQNSSQPVQFSAVGTYSGGSPAQGPVSSLQWCASSETGPCNGGISTPAVNISQTGLAQCTAGATGTWTITASSPPMPGQPGGYSGPPIVWGSAKLTCP